MKLLRLEAENVFSIGHIVLPLHKRGLLLVTGYSNDDKTGNGAGKSSLANHAIVWGLYGQTYDGTRGNSVVNRNSDSKFGKVEIDFQSSNGRLWKIVRTRNPNSLKLYSAGVRVDDRAFSVKELYDSGHRLEKETQLQIDHLLGRNFNTFIQADLLGPGTERSFFRLSGSEQIDIIESLLPMGDLDNWAYSAKENLELVISNIDTVTDLITKLEGKLEVVRERSTSISRQHSVWISNRKAKILNYKNTLSSLKDKQNNHNAVIEKCEEAIAKFNTVIPDRYKQGADNLSSERGEVERAVGASKARLDNLKQAIQLHHCDRCGQDVPEVHRRAVEATYREEEAVLKDLLVKSSQLSMWIMCRKQLQEKQAELMNMRVASFDSQIEATRNNIEQLEAEDSPFFVELDDLEQTINNYQEELSALGLREDRLLEHKKWLEFWARGFSKDIKTMMIEEICPFLETRINGYLKDLGNAQFKARVSTVKSLKSGDIREKFNLEIQSDHGANSFDLLSVGEKQIVSFAASLAVADLATTQVGGRSNILILDEPFMGLHKNNCDKIINFLNNSNVETILLISNEDNLKAMVPNRIHVVKTKGQSWLE